MRRWLPSKSDGLLLVALLIPILLAGFYFTDQINRNFPWVHVLIACLTVILAWRLFGVLFPATSNGKGPSERQDFILMPWLAFYMVFNAWIPYPSNVHYLGPGCAAGLTAAFVLRAFRRWQASRTGLADNNGRPSSEDEGSISNNNREHPRSTTDDDPINASDFVWIIFGLIFNLVVPVCIVVWIMSTGAIWRAVVQGICEGVFASLPGGSIMIFGHPLLAYSAALLFELAFSIVVTSAFLRALTTGARDFKLGRIAQYAIACLPFAAALVLSFWLPTLALGSVTSLALLIAFGILTNYQPDVAFSKVTAARAIWHGHMKPMIRRARALDDQGPSDDGQTERG